MFAGPSGAAPSGARQIGQEFQESPGQPFLVDNRPGAQGVVGAELVAWRVPDGYTILVAAVSFAATEALMKKLPYDIVKDFTVYAVYPNRKFLPPKVRSFIDFLAERFGPEPYWDFDSKQK